MSTAVTLTKIPNYSNWVSKKFIVVPGIIGLLFLGVSLFSPLWGIVAVLFLLVSAYFTYAWCRFSPQGGNVQSQILGLLMARVDWNGQGKVLDIGCGNGPLTIKLALRYSGAQITGIDYWGKNWDYSKTVCENNAAIEGVANQTNFQKASAAALPLDDESFDLVVSNLVFHEVGEVKDKRELVKEALRVVKKGGHFAFQDLFIEEHLYGKPEELVEAVKSWGITKVELVRTCDESFIPGLLKLPFMVGKIGILYGIK